METSKCKDTMTTKTTLLLLALLQRAASAQDPILELPNGQILGREAVTYEGTNYFAFEKIPYGAPPVGDLRFKAPQPAEKWEGVLNTTILDVSCYLMGMTPTTPSEDCLYLNVYTPKLPSTDDTELLPVMLFIFGGGFIAGWNEDYQPELLLNNGVILMTVSYRVATFGFLSTQDEVIPGNNGLKDQVLALQWTQDNVHLFGGDPDKVTIFGQSAGGGSCAYHLLNQNGAGLFAGVIIESGSAISPAMYQRNAREIAFGTAAVLNSTFETNRDSQALYEFLMSVSAEDLDAASEAYSDSISHIYDEVIDQGALYAPVVEVKNPDAFLTKKMYGLFEAGSALAVPVLMGFTSEENLIKIHEDLMPNITAILDDNLGLIVPYDMRITDPDQLKEMGEKIREIYTGGEPFADHFGAAVRYGTDQAHTRAMTRQAELFSKIAPTYFYQFSYDGELGDFTLKFDGAGTVVHTEELRYLFCGGHFAACNDTDYPEADLLTRQRLLKIWTDFAKYQNPTPEPSELLQNITWPLVDTEAGDFLYVDIGENLEIKNHPKEEYYGKWVELYNSLGYDDFDTY